MKQKLKDLSDNEKLAQIVGTSKELFWKYGIKRVTIEEICSEAGVSKMTFYKHFSNKAQLVKLIIEKITSETIDRYNAIMGQDIPFDEKIRQSVQLKMEATNEMSHEFFDDYLIHADPELKGFLNEKTRESFDLIYNDFVEAQKRGDIRQDLNPAFIMYFLNQMMEMIRDEQLEKHYANPQELIMEFTNFFFYGIMPRDRQVSDETKNEK